MSNFAEAADQIRNLARLYKHMENAAGVLDSIADLDRLLGEKKQAIADIESSRIQLEQVFNARKQEIDETLAGAEKRAEAVKAEVAAIKAKAEADASDIVAKAEAEAKAIEDNTSSAAEHMMNEAKAKRDEAQRQASEAKQEAANAREQLAVASAELALVESKLERAREAARMVMGA